MGGYLLLWSGTAPTHAEYGLAKFLSEHGNDERRVSCNALLAIADQASRRSETKEANELFTRAIRGFWGLGDYPGVVHGHYRFAMSLQRHGQWQQATDMIKDALELAEREANEIGIGLLEFATALGFEHSGRHNDARDHFATAATIGAKTGHLWLEAGALQGLARTDRHSSELVIEWLLRSLELVHWSSGGSAPAPWMGGMANSFRAVDELKRTLGGREPARAILDSNPFLAEIGLDGSLSA